MVMSILSLNIMILIITNSIFMNIYFVIINFYYLLCFSLKVTASLAFILCQSSISA